MDQDEIDLRERARKRVVSRYHLSIYLVMVLVFWATWYVATYPEKRGIPWPIFPMIGWGMGILFHYLSAYHGDKAVSKELEKLRKLSK